jgi:hypothetical protein
MKEDRGRVLPLSHDGSHDRRTITWVYSEAVKVTELTVAQSVPLHVGSWIGRNCSCSFNELFRCLFSSLMIFGWLSSKGRPQQGQSFRFMYRAVFESFFLALKIG